MPLRWLGDPQSWSVPGEDSLLVDAGPRTDWFVDPQRAREPKLNAPALVGDAGGDFLLSARVTVDFAGTYDAGVLSSTSAKASGRSCASSTHRSESRWWSRS